MEVFWLLCGLGVLIVGGEFLVRGAVSFSKVMKISPLVVGMTVVAFGTSAPELIVSLTSALQGNPGIAVGNVIGSNIANITLVLGLTVLIFPIVAEKQTKALDYPVMIFATALLCWFVSDGEIGRYEGMSMVVLLVGFTIYLVNYARRKSQAAGNQDWVEERKSESYWKSIFFLHMGFVGLYFGAEWFVDGAVGLADMLLYDNPQKDTIIGVTVVAVGTSAPELVASTVAAYRKETDISLGNLVGSNIFNILIVLGLTAAVKPTPVAPAVLNFDLWWVVGSAILLGLAIYLGKKIGRLKGLVLVLSYVAYIAWIILMLQGGE
jgi:cation:H+ antiporter